MVYWRPLLLVVLPPLATGLILRARGMRTAAQLEPAFRVASNAALLLIIVLGIGANLSNVVRDGSLSAIVAGVLLVLVSLGLGFSLGGPHMDTRRVMALGTSQRNVSVAFLVGMESFHEPKVITALAILALVAFCIQVPTAFALRAGKVQTLGNDEPLATWLSGEPPGGS